MGRSNDPRLRRLRDRAARGSRSARRQLRKALGKQRGVEWRHFGNVTRRWSYFRPTLAGTWDSCSRAGHQARVPVVPAGKDPPRDALNTLIAMRAKTIGHLANPDDPANGPRLRQETTSPES